MVLSAKDIFTNHGTCVGLLPQLTSPANSCKLQVMIAVNSHFHTMPLYYRHSSDSFPHTTIDCRAWSENEENNTMCSERNIRYACFTTMSLTVWNAPSRAPSCTFSEVPAERLYLQGQKCDDDYVTTPCSKRHHRENTKYGKSHVAHWRTMR